MSENPLDRYLQADDAPRRRHFLGPFVAIIGLGLILAGILFSTKWLEESAFLQRAQCTVLLGSEKFVLAPDQTRYASIISAAGLNRGLERHEVMIALATARQESKIRNISYGDTAGPDSRGLFQQRPSQGWGTEEQVMDPWYASDRFYQELESVPNYQSLSVTEAAQAVQRSAYPDAYARHEQLAAAFARALTEGEPGALNCGLKPAGNALAELSPKQLQQLLGRFAQILNEPHPVTRDGVELQLPVTSEPNGWRLANWALANAQAADVVSISYNGLEWNRQKRAWAAGADNTDAVLKITILDSSSNS